MEIRTARMVLAQAAIATATGLLKQVYGSYAEDRTLVVPLSKPSNFEMMTKSQIKKKYCPPQRTAPRRAAPPTKAKKPKRKRKTNLEKIIERRV